VLALASHAGCACGLYGCTYSHRSQLCINKKKPQTLAMHEENKKPQKLAMHEEAAATEARYA
jgi:hypothetical protein